MAQLEQRFIDAAKASAAKYGVPASVTLAQFILESGYGKHDLGVNNYFGIKFGSLVQGATGSITKITKEYISGKMTVVSAKFAKFPDAESCFMEHARFIAQHPELGRAMKYKDDPDQFCYALQNGKVKYATLPTYAETLIKLMKQLNLYQYDCES